MSWVIRVKGLPTAGYGFSHSRYRWYAVLSVGYTTRSPGRFSLFESVAFKFETKEEAAAVVAKIAMGLETVSPEHLQLEEVEIIQV